VHSFPLLRDVVNQGCQPHLLLLLLLLTPQNG
jgi:hypothetical protein